MALQPYALCSMSEFKALLTVTGGTKDDDIERAINTASRLIEADLGRRLRFRAPEEVEGGANTVASVAIANGSLTVAAQPGTGGRTVIVTLTDADRSVRAGTVTVTGTVGGTAGVTEAFDLADGQSRYHGRRFFTAISSIVVASLVGASASDFIKVGTSLGYVEYHSIFGGEYKIKLREWPLYAVAEINEDSARTFASTTALTVSTEYETAANGAVTRLSSSLPTSFESGWRALKARYSAGYGAISSVPPDLRNVCLTLAGMIYQEPQRGPLGTTSVSDQLGNFTRLAPTGITSAMSASLGEYRRPDIFDTTAERDFDEEAV